MRILLVVHGFPPAASGGTEVYVHDLAAALAVGGDEVFVLTRDADPHRRELSVRRTVDGGVTAVSINNTFQSCKSFEESYTNPALRRVAAAALDQIDPDVVHVQHLTCLSTGLLDVAGSRRVPLVMTLNDYWLMCHRGQLLDLNGCRCDGPFGEGCAACIPASVLAGPGAYRAGRMLRSVPIPGAGRVVQLASKGLEAATPAGRTQEASAARLRHMQQAASHVDLFLAPSATLERKFLEFGIPRDRIKRCNQGIALRPFAGAIRTPSPVFRIAFAGGLSPSKAPDVLLDAISRLPEGSVAVDLLGGAGAYHGDGGYAEALDARLKHPAIRRLGPVPHDRMARILAGVDVVVVPSIWIENAPFIIREAFAAGAPVIASNLGGMAEMVRDGVDGLLFPPGDSAALAERLRELIGHPERLASLREGIRPPMSIEEDAAALRSIYTALGKRARTTAARAPSRADRAPRVAAVVLNYRTPDQTWLAVKSLQTSLVPPSEIIVVDNESQDGSVEALRAALPGVDCLEAGSNLGFSGGCNVGIRAALDRGAAYVLLVNSDAVLAPGALKRLLEAAHENPAIGVLAPVLLSREEPDRIASAGIAFSTATGRMRHRDAGRRLTSLPPVAVRDVDAVSGCVMLVRRDVFERAGLLDERYFFSFEDIDFCLRARAAGFGCACVQDAIVYHEGGRSIGRGSARRVYFATRNHLRLVRIAGGIRGRRLRSGAVVALNAAYVLLAPEAPLLRGLAAVVRGTWHHVNGRYGPD